MAFVDYEYFTSLYGANAITQETFNRLLWKAEHIMCDATTGVDGFCKLKGAFPEDEATIEAIKRCACELVDISNQIEKANMSVSDGKAIKSVTAGNESISYDTTSGIIHAVMSDKKAQTRLFQDTIDAYLKGTKDKNGVNLLYVGVYPCRNVGV